MPQGSCLQATTTEPVHLQPMLCSQRSHKPRRRNRGAQFPAARESPRAAVKTQNIPQIHKYKLEQSEARGRASLRGACQVSLLSHGKEEAGTETIGSRSGASRRGGSRQLRRPMLQMGKLSSEGRLSHWPRVSECGPPDSLTHALNRYSPRFRPSPP